MPGSTLRLYFGASGMSKILASTGGRSGRGTGDPRDVTSLSLRIDRMELKKGDDTIGFSPRAHRLYAPPKDPGGKIRADEDRGRKASGLVIVIRHRVRVPPQRRRVFGRESEAR